MNVVKKKRKRVTTQQNRDYLDFNRINPIGVDQMQRPTNNANHQNETSFTTFATRGNSVVKQSSTYLSITSGRGYAHGEVGIAYIDIESPAVKLIQLSDDPWYSGLLMKINIIDPCQIIVPHTIYDAKSETFDGKLIKYIREEFPKLCLTKVPRRHFSETEGTEMIKRYCSDKYNYVKEEVASKYYALSAAAGLLKYLQFIHNIFFKENSLKLEFETKFAHMQIDINTSYRLELLAQSSPNTVKSNFPSLFDALDHCVTSFGKRTLRARILEPMCDIPSITEIQDCIAELNQAEHFELCPILVNVLRNFNNIERLHKLVLVVPQEDNVRAAEVLINQALHLKKCLQLVPDVRCKLGSLTCKKFQEIQENLMDERYESMLNHIDTVINRNLLEFQRDSSSQLFQRINCVQKGVNDLVDILRKSYSEIIEQIEGLVGEMSTKYGQAFKMNYSVQRGFHVVLMIAHRAVINDFPDELEVIEIKRNTCFLTTPDVNKLNIRAQNVIEEITIQSNVVIAVMLNEMVKEIDAIYDLSGFTATLDIILSFATVSASENCVCPTFGDEMRIVDAVHPLLEQNIYRTVAIPNNIIATPEYNFFIITGPNMGGKTVYIKMIAILQIMAQLGCFVPAKSAQFRITDRIFSRMGFNDSIEKNMSTFITEMSNMEHILKNVTPNSLVIIDELCRSTNPKEGAQLAWNLCVHLASIRGIFNDGKYFLSDANDGVSDDTLIDDNGTTDEGIVSVVGPISTTTRSSNWRNTKLNAITSPYIFLTTHFHSLTKLPDSHFNVVNLSFSADQMTNNEHQQQLIYHHRIQEGVTTTTSYGLAVARTVRFPVEVLNRATQLSQDLLIGENAGNMNENGTKRKLSRIGQQVVRLHPNSRIEQTDDVASVVSAMINTSITSKRRRRFRRPKSLMGASSVASSTTYEDHLKIDRILYNSYGDLMSTSRNAQIDWEAQYVEEENSEFVLQDMQDHAIERFLIDFCREQPDNLIKAIADSELSNEMNVPAAKESNARNSDGIIHRTISPIKSTVSRNSEKSSIISMQFISVQPSVNRMSDSLIRERRISSSDDSDRDEDSNYKRITNDIGSTNFSPLRTPLKPEEFSMPKLSSLPKPSFEDDEFQFDNDALINSNFNASPLGEQIHQNNMAFENPTQSFNFDGIDVSSFAEQKVAGHTSQFSHESFARSQSENNLFTPTNDNDNLFASKYFSQQEDHFDFSPCRDENNDDFGQSPFRMPSFSSQLGSQLGSQSQREMPQLSNIRHTAMTSRSLVNLSSRSSSGSNSPNSKVSKVSNNNSSYRSSDSTRSGSTFEPTKFKRKIPKIHKSKPNVFGDTSKLFEVPPKSNMATTGNKTSAKKRHSNVAFDERATDTNYTETLKRLQKIAHHNTTGANKNNEKTQHNVLNQSASTQQQKMTDTPHKTMVPASPPPGFK